MVQMAKKKSRAADEKNYLPRKDDMTYTELVAAISGMESAIGELKGYAKEMHDSKHSVLNIDGIQKLPRAKQLLEEFAANVWHAVRRANIKRTADTGARVQ
jgi:hypothetical protein